MWELIQEYWTPLFWFVVIFLNPFFYIIFGDLRDIAIDLADRYERWKEDSSGEKLESFEEWYESKHGKRPY